MTNQEWNDRFDRMSAIIAGLLDVGQQQQLQLRRHDEGILELRAAMASLAATLDQFLKGKPNGH